LIPAESDKPAELTPRIAPNEPNLAAIGASAQRKAAWRLLPIISIGYGLAYMDRINISFASLRMNSDLHFSATVYGLGAGLFFIGYALCEVPSNLLLLRFGPKRWLARIMLTWGLLAASMMFVRTPLEFYSLRLLLGMAEAGFFPGVIYYLTLWFPASMRARAVSRFYVALPLSSVLMGSVAGWLLGLQGKLGLAGWQWLFLLEGLPAALFSFVIFGLLPDGPAKAKWLTLDEKSWLQRQLDADSAHAHLGREAGVLQALLSPKVWLIGLFFFSALTCSYGYGFSAPAILQAVTGWNVSQVGYLVACFGVAGAASMLFGGVNSDRTGGLFDCQLRKAAVAGRGFTRSQFCCIQCAAGAGPRSPHAIHDGTRRSRRHCRDEHHHHVQRIRRPVLDGCDERQDRQLLARTARADGSQSGGSVGHVCVDAKPGAS
jgi:ACS family tartrate transporter-like MFS transporter